MPSENRAHISAEGSLLDKSIVTVEKYASPQNKHVVQGHHVSDDSEESRSITPSVSDDEDYYSPSRDRAARKNLKPAVKGVNLLSLINMREDEVLEILENGSHRGSAKRKDFGYVHLKCQPRSLSGGTLKPYQLEGLQWLANNYSAGMNCILADEMGLGKTVQTIALMCHLKDDYEIRGPHLVLGPRSTLGNWCNELQKFAPTFNVVKYHGGREWREGMNDRLSEYDVIVTSYEMLLREHDLFSSIDFSYLVIDEAHRIKNDESKLSITCRDINCTNRLLLTGTPLQNNLRELWSLLNFLFPLVFTNADDFDAVFNLSEADVDMEQRNQVLVTKLRHLLRPFMLRRHKDEVLKEIPPKCEILLMIPLSQMQKKLYRELLSRNITTLFDSSVAQKGRLQNLAIELRKCCNHPYLFEDVEDKTQDPFGPHVIDNCGKLAFLDNLVKRQVPKGHKLLVFSQMVRLLDILDDYCRMRGYNYCRVDGNTIDRETQIDRFQAPDSIYQIFLLSTRAGGLGINLTNADTIVIYDSDWNPQADLQAIDRAHRIGQKNPVTVYRFIHEHTIEEKIYERAQLKLQLDHAVIERGGMNRSKQREQGPNKDLLLQAVTYGASRIFSTGTDDLETLDENDFDKIFAQGQAKQQALTAKWQAQLNRSLMDFTGMDSTTDTDQLANMFADNISIEIAADRDAWIQGADTLVDEEKAQKRRARNDGLRRQELEACRLKISAKESPIPTSAYPWHFLDINRLNELSTKESNFVEESRYQHTVTMAMATKEFEKIARIRSKILSESFIDWSKGDYMQFIKSCEIFGSKNKEDIIRDTMQTTGRSEESIGRFYDTFFERMHELPEWKRIQQRFNKSEAELQRRAEYNEITRKKVSGNWNHFDLPKVVGQPRKLFDDKSDRWLLNLVSFGFGYGEWDRVRVHSRHAIETKYDWVLNTRSSNEWRNRADTLSRAYLRDRSSRRLSAAKDVSAVDPTEMAEESPASQI